MRLKSFIPLWLTDCAEFLKQLFCKHDYKMVGEHPPIPDLKPGEMWACTMPHKCTKCGKETTIGSGFIC